MTRQRKRYPTLVFNRILAACALCLTAMAIHYKVVSASVFENQATLNPTPTTETVMVIGGSMAHGWKDPHDNSYIKQAIASFANGTNTQYIYSDRTIIGATAASMAKKQPNQFGSWIALDHPQVVVIAWGLMDDIYDKTPMKDFDQAIQDEIQQALNANAVVLVVTPPVVQGAMSVLTTQNQYIANEFHVAEQFQSPNVRTFDVFGDMLTYMQSHQQTPQSYYGDNWHPNGAGHQLGGQLLYNEMIDTFGLAPIRFLGRNTLQVPLSE